MKDRIIKYLSILALAFTLSVGTSLPAEAQCPMCRMSAESNLKNGGTQGQGLNNGILFMLATPYFIVGALGFIWWKNRKREEEEEELA